MSRESGIRQRSRPVSPPSPAGGGDSTSAVRESSARERVDDYEVGYGKPPEHTRFKRGRSGNPKGRPKGSKNFKTLIDRELDAKVVIREAGKRQQLSKREVVAKQLVKKALEGQDRAIAAIIKLDEALEAVMKAHEAAGEAAATEESLDEDDRAILADFTAQILEKHGRTGGQAADGTAGDANETEEVEP